MLGAIVGDIVGSRYEYNNIKRKDFQFFNESCFVTDDTVLTLAVCDALLKNSNDLNKTATDSLRTFSRRYADKDYGDGFRRWMLIDDAQPYGSFGNGAAMRVSPCSIAAQTLEEVKMMSEAVTSPTHNHPEGLKGAEATAVAGFLAKRGRRRNCAVLPFYLIRAPCRCAPQPPRWRPRRRRRSVGYSPRRWGRSRRRGW